MRGGNARDLNITRYKKQKKSYKHIAYLKISQNLRTNREKYYLKCTIVTLQDKKSLLQNLHNFNIEGAMGPQNSKITIEIQKLQLKFEFVEENKSFMNFLSGSCLDTNIRFRHVNAMLVV